jgi:3-oxoacyl-[acyl-carrier-protein] synthase II
MSNRVVITGMGGICALGKDVDEMFDNVKNGVCGISEATQFDRVGINNVYFAGEVNDFDPSQYIKKREMKRLDRFTQFAVYAGMQAWEDSGLVDFDPYKVGVIMGSGMGGLKTVSQNQDTLRANGASTISALFIPKVIINIAPGALAIRLGLNGPCYGVVTACASSADAIGQAFRLVKDGRLDAVLVGGSEAVIDDLAIGGFNQMSALSNSDKRDRASIPFDVERGGFVMGEGAGFIVLEEEKAAIKRGAKIYGEIGGYGQTCDANHITAPMEGGVHVSKAMELAVEEAGVKKTDVKYINAHGTGTPLNDKAETQAIKHCFGEHSKNMLVSSTKSMTGHLLGAAGVIETIFTVKSLDEGIAPPTIHLQKQDPECDLDYVANKAKPMDAKCALSNSLGFGGHNGSLLIKKY